MSEEARIIEQVNEVLADVEPDVAIRVIDHFTINLRPELKAQRDAVRRAATPEGQTTEKPGFLHTERRIDAAEVLREVERIEALKKNS